MPDRSSVLKTLLLQSKTHQLIVAAESKNRPNVLSFLPKKSFRWILQLRCKVGASRLKKSKTKISAKFENYAKQKIIFEAFLAAVVVIWKSDGFPVQKKKKKDFFHILVTNLKNFMALLSFWNTRVSKKAH